MHRIDTSTAQTDKFGPGKNGFTNGDKIMGRRATQFTDTYCDAVQEELCSVIEAANITLSKNDNSQLLAAINKLIVNSSHPVGIVAWFAQNRNPNDIYPGTTWKYIGENKTVRLAKSDGRDVLTTGGADSVTIITEHLPAHSHTFSASTSSFDHGSKTTASGGAHTHNVTGTAASAGAHTHTLKFTGSDSGQAGSSSLPASGQSALETSGTAAIASAGAHTHSVTGTAAVAGAHMHTVAIGSHTHTVNGRTGTIGGNTPMDVTNSYIKLMAWYRTA